jgi:hypothetical protein
MVLIVLFLATLLLRVVELAVDQTVTLEKLVAQAVAVEL